MLLTSLIERKRDGGRLTPPEFRSLLDAYLNHEFADYQMSAFLMAAFLRGLDGEELSALTSAIIESGTRLNFSDGGPPAVDKHSTGGVGDKVSLVLAPLLAAAGLRVPMISGRGLGHTGGTLDKLEAIPGFQVLLGLDRFQSILAEIGCAVIGQTDEIAPLDGRLYALRDVTGTVPSPPLMAASIISKKAAEGISALVLDVKCGRGAFMTDRRDAEGLARIMVDLARSEGVRATALLTAMDVPLGRTVGNALEVREAIDCLSGAGPTALRAITIALGTELLVSAGASPSAADANRRLEGLLDDGSALERFERLIESQGGDPRVVQDPDRLPAAAIQADVLAPAAGYVDIDARGVGLASIELGAGRQRAGDTVDPSVGFELHADANDRIEVGERLFTVHARTEASARKAERQLLDATTIRDTRAAESPLVLARME